MWAVGPQATAEVLQWSKSQPPALSLSLDPGDVLIPVPLASIFHLEVGRGIEDRFVVWVGEGRGGLRLGAARFSGCWSWGGVGGSGGAERGVSGVDEVVPGPVAG
jgi:hypothetical protein